VLRWARAYDRHALSEDLLAALMVTVLVIPQSLAYAMLAGLPPEVGLYASVVPALLYALFCSSSALAVGPVAVASLMTAAAIGDFAAPGSPAYAPAALTLAFLSGSLLLAMGLLRLGFLANFLSHPVISGFVSASGLIIALSQLRTLLGLQGGGNTLPEVLASLLPQWQQAHGLTLAVGAGTLVFLYAVRLGLKPLLLRAGLGAGATTLVVSAAPVVAIAACTALSWQQGWHLQGLKVVGSVPQGLPPLSWPSWDPSLLRQLALPALLISIVGFAESVSLAQTLAARRRERIEPDQELVALGAANLGAAFTSGLPVTGGFSRSVLNVEAGARTPAAGAFTALGILGASLLVTPALFHLPQATLAASIVVAVLSLVDLGTLRRTWAFARSDFAAVAATLVATLLLGLEAGLALGVGLSLALHLLHTSRPHIVEVGLVPGTQHFRNVQRYETRVSPQVLGLRVDESLYFANARALEDHINEAMAQRPALKHVVLQCSAVNDIDASALESLVAIELRLREAGVALHLSEVKGPVMDKLRDTAFLQQLTGPVFLTHYQAMAALAPEVLQGQAPA
jgi:SulP family sulfate permease